MDSTYMTKMATAFVEELTEIEKQGGPLGFLGSGLKHLGGALTKKVSPQLAKKGLGAASRFGGKNAVQAGGLGNHIKNIYRGGTTKALGKGKNEMLGGLKALGSSRYGQMATAVAAPVALGYGAHKVMS